MKLGISDPDEYKARFKLVRRDDFNDIAGLIIEADEDTGSAKVQREDVVTFELGEGGFRIVARGR